MREDFKSGYKRDTQLFYKGSLPLVEAVSSVLGSRCGVISGRGHEISNAWEMRVSLNSEYGSAEKAIPYLGMRLVHSHGLCCWSTYGMFGAMSIWSPFVFLTAVPCG